MQKILDKNEKKISGMFDSIASKYDRMNHLMSLGIDRIWRRRFVNTLAKSLPMENPSVLDLACGTGDLTKAMAQRGWRVTAMDISAEMMEIGKKKCGHLDPLPLFVQGSAEAIPYPDHSFDAVTISFGLRNFDHRVQCLAEVRRVLKPGGQFAVLDFAVPRNRLWRSLYLFYFKHGMYLMGRIIGRRDAYGYFVDSVLAFPCFDALSAEITAAGFSAVRYIPYTGAISVAYFAE